MKISRIIIAAAAIAVAVACNKEAFNNESIKEGVTIITGEKTKTSLEGKGIFWTSDDQIAVFDNTGARNIFGITETEGSYASFSGSVTSGTTHIYAVYPENLAISATDGNFKVLLPANQTPKAGSFAEEHNISVAKATKIPGNETISGVTFKNVCGLLKFTIPAYIEDAQSVTFESNSVIAGELTVDFTSDTPSVSVSDAGSKSVTMTGSYPAGSEFVFVLAPGTIDGFTITVTTEKATWTISKNVDIELQAGKYKNLGTLELAPATTVSATSAHTYENENLIGTTVTINLNIPESTLKYITGLSLTIKNEDGEIVRTYEKNGASAIETLSPSDDQEWPYLPKGTYYVSGQYTLSGNTVKELETISFTNTEDPVFSVKSLAYSSYSKYLANAIDAANECDAETIYNITSADITISDAIRNNSNYDQITGSAFILDDVAISDAQKSNLSWGSHNVTASYHLDGVDESHSVECHITGLPYKPGVPSNTGEHPWNKVNCTINWGNNYVEMYWDWGDGGSPIIVSPTFHIPGNINVNVSSKFSRNGTKLNGNYIIGASKSGNTVNDRIVDTRVNSNETYEDTATGTMSTSVDKWYVQYSYAAIGPKSYLYYFNIYYRQ